MRSVRLTCVAVCLCVVAACSQAELEYHGTNYNRAIESTSNDQLLLNVIRASKDLPLHFTGINQYTGKQVTTASFTPKLPFGRDAALNFEFGPKFDWSSGLSSIDIGNLNTQEALSRLSAEISVITLESALLYGGPGLLHMNLLLEVLQIHGKVFNKIHSQVLKLCGNNSPSPKCQPIIEEADACAPGKLLSINPVKFAGEEFYQFYSRARSKCSYLKFQAFLAPFDIAGAAFDIRPRAEREQNSQNRAAGPGGNSEAASKGKSKPFALPQAVTRRPANALTKKKADKDDEDQKDERPPVYAMHLHFGDSDVDGLYKSTDQEMREKNMKAIEIRLRSPKRIIEYLGEITALQNYVAEPYSPMIPVGGGKKAFLFRLLREDLATGRPAIMRVRGPLGESFVVPEPEFGAPDRDRTLVVLSLTSHLVNLSIQKSALPTPAAIEVRPIQ